MPPRRLLLLNAALFVLTFSLPPSAEAAGCHTACSLTVPPDCLGCGFVMFGNVMCIRAGCDLCFEDPCWTALPTATAPGPAGIQDSRLTCSTPQEPQRHSVRVVAVQTLPART